MAAASGIPTLAIFGPTQDVVYAPWGEHSSVVRTKIGFEKIFPDNFNHRESDTLMDSLSVDTAEEGANDLWRRCQDLKT